MKIKAMISGFLAISMVCVLGCSAGVGATEIKSSKTRSTLPAASDSDLASLVSGNTAFALDLYHQLKTKDGNLFYSPYSISLALALLYAGASNQTADELARTLYFDLSQDKLHATINYLDLLLNSRGLNAKNRDGQPFELTVVNAIWGQKDYNFLIGYLDTLAVNYGIGLRALDFVKDPENARQTINKWVSDQTKKRIPELIPQGAINGLTRMVLTNAIYFNAAWATPFAAESTHDDTFYLLGGNKIVVPMMNQKKAFGYTEGSIYQAVVLPFDGNELGMLIIVPKSEQFAAFENSLDASRLNNILASLQTREVILSLPKFQYDFKLNLKAVLGAMGMTSAFDPEAADFSGLSGNRDLYVSDIFHQAFVSVDENGTEATAATAIIIGTTSMPVDTVTLKIDRPFIYTIYDFATGEILFLGRVVNPAS